MRVMLEHSPWKLISTYFSFRTSQVVSFFFKTTINKWKSLTYCTTQFFFFKHYRKCFRYYSLWISQTRNIIRKTCLVLATLLPFLWKPPKVERILFSFYLSRTMGLIIKCQCSKAERITALNYGHHGSLTKSSVNEWLQNTGKWVHEAGWSWTFF